MIGVILAAAGTGSRFGSDVPKQFLDYQGRPVYLRALDPFAPQCDQMIVVVPPAWTERITRQLEGQPYGPKVQVEPGGAERQDSVSRGLSRLSSSVGLVLVHDAARPFLSEKLVAAVIEGTRQNGACIPCLSVGDTIKEVDSDRVLRTLDRSRIRLAQTPQGFDVGLLRRAMAEAARRGFYGTDEASLLERMDIPVAWTAGEPGNRKITWKEDWDAG